MNDAILLTIVLSSIIVPIPIGFFLFYRSGKSIAKSLTGSLWLGAYALVIVVVFALFSALVLSLLNINLLYVAPLIVFGYFVWLIKKNMRNEFDSQLTVEEANKIINSYGSILEKSSAGGSVVSDASVLPFPKHVIKSAILLALRNSNNEHEAEMLKVGYLSLADFQLGF